MTQTTMHSFSRMGFSQMGAGLGRRAFAVCAGVALLCASQVGLAAAAPVNQQDAEAYIQDMGSRVVALLNDSASSEAEKAEKMAGLVNEGIDIEQVAVLAAGRSWRSADDEQKAAYMDLFRKYVTATYTRRLDEYAGTSFAVTGSQPVGREDVLVVTRIEGGGGPPSDVGWRVRDRGAGLKVIDVDFGGVSMLKTQREEFAAVIERAGGEFDALIEALEERVRAGGAS